LRQHAELERFSGALQLGVTMPACSNGVVERTAGEAARASCGGAERGAASGGAADGAAAPTWRTELAMHWWRRTARGRALRAWRRRTMSLTLATCAAAKWLCLAAGPRGALLGRAVRAWRSRLWGAAAVRAAAPAAAAARRVGRALEAWRRAAGVVTRRALLVRLLQRARRARAWRRWARRTRRMRRAVGGARAGGGGGGAAARARAMRAAAAAHDATARARRGLRAWRLAVAVQAMLAWASTFAASRWARR